jgi:hypothetical protein
MVALVSFPSFGCAVFSDNRIEEGHYASNKPFRKIVNVQPADAALAVLAEMVGKFKTK